ncbi:enoyl-CoA hydratase-related protein [Frankia sp. Mgl5]|uniref:enoyl-CoA hydratase-related protein n=1 Tax=Frankiaceae TaxID=74712 RepID=UPI00200C3F95|nr:enoyl-CoA hydratase-related protein [Frankia sp. Mgl5]MCK9932920.1 enoyl-CoA hydratase-related protein [Frankia sp. Mgl5]
MTDTDTSTADILLERVGAVLVIRLNRPEARNALTPALLSAIGSAILTAESDPDIRVAVLTAAGEKAFCVGMDLKAFTSGGGFSQIAPEDKEGRAAFDRLMSGDVKVPLVGAANGTAVGGGFELLLSCDVVVASSAAKFGLPEVKRGLLAAGGGAVAIASRIPLALALELTLTGDTVDAARAQQLGLVNAVAEPEKVLEAALAFAERIAANGPLAVAATKEIVRAAAADPARGQERMAQLSPAVFKSEDAKEGAMAFIQKRTPQWKGR